MIYLFSTAVIFVFAITHNYSNRLGFNDNKKYIAFALLTYVAAFAYMLGSDTPEYVGFYQHLEPINFLTSNHISQYRYQPGFTIFCSILRFFSNNYLLFQFIHAILVNLVIFRFCNKYSHNPYISLLAYMLINYLEFNFEIQRESLAVICGLLAYDCYIHKRLLLSILYFFLAYFFHFSAIILLLIPVLLKFKSSKRNIYILALFAAISPWIWRSIPNAELFLLLTTDGSIYSSYINQEINTDYNLYYYISFYIMNMGIPLVVLFFIKNKNPYYQNLVLAFILFRMLSLFSYGFYRFSNYFVCFYWIALADFLPYICTKYKKNKVFVYAVVLSIICFTNQTKLFWYEAESNRYIFQRYYPYSDIIFDGKHF